VTTPHPIGEKTLELELELVPEEWEGMWMTTEGDVVYVTDVDPKQASALATWVDEDSNELVLKRSSVYFGQVAGTTFVSMPDESASPVRYVWGRIKRENETAVVWLPDSDKFEMLVEEGLLPGVVDGGDVHLAQLDSSHYTVIASEQHGVLFEWDEPLVYRRVKH
jgi:hypothetical protein